MVLLLKIICPKVIPNRKSNWGYRVRFYHWLLLRLQPLYKRCAVSDTFSFGDMQVVHNVRDYWYEQELQRFHVDTAQHLEPQNVPFSVKRSNRRPLLFNWSETLSVYHNRKSYVLKRSNKFSIETELDGRLKISGAKDLILRSEFVTKVTKPRKDADLVTVLESVTERAGGKQPRSKISVKDTIPSATLPVEPIAESVKYRGFEENSIF